MATRQYRVGCLILLLACGDKKDKPKLRPPTVLSPTWSTSCRVVAIDNPDTTVSMHTDQVAYLGWTKVDSIGEAPDCVMTIMPKVDSIRRKQ